VNDGDDDMAATAPNEQAQNGAFDIAAPSPKYPLILEPEELAPQVLPVDSPPGVRTIGPAPTDRKAREWALVLQSMSIGFVLQRMPGGWFLLVDDASHAAAAKAIGRYEVENRDWPPRVIPERPRHPSSPIAAAAFLALAVFLFVTGPASSGSKWFHHGASISNLVIASQPWRAVTALTLHADSVHVMGNVISGAIFASAVSRRLGPGGGLLAVLASGIAGNLANAFAHHAMGEGTHGSIGASTAVFGAVGILAATQVVVDRQRSSGARRGWLEILAPLVGGLALLGALGASPEADLGAHLFGFFAGVLIGGLASIRLRNPLAAASRWWAQTTLGALALATVLGSWQLAMR
jgi:rhomboid protease GluP